jgi:hypothetical protein
MQNLTKSLMMGSLLAAAAFADLPITIPTVAADVSTTYGVTLDSTSANAAQIKKLCGATFYKGVASSASLTETTLGELALKYALVYSAQDGNGKYGTSIGFLVPITAAWDIKDLSKATSIDYEIKAASAGVTAHLLIGAKDGVYPATMAAENASLASGPTDPLTTSYTKVSVAAATLTTPTWMTSVEGAAVGWIADGVTYTIGTAPYVKNLNIQPILDPAWNAGTSFKSTAAALVCINNTLTIRNIVIKGVDLYPPILSTCAGTSVLLDDFTSPVGRKAADPNLLGGYWYAFTDTSSVVKANDTAVGSSTITLPAGAKKWLPTLNTAAVVTATLEKNVGTVFHKYAGWADIGTDLPGGNPDGSLDLQGLASGNALTGISFDLYAGASLASVVTGAAFDTTTILKVIFKVGRSSVADEGQFQANIPIHQATTGTQGLCVLTTDLSQPGWYTKPVAWSAEDLTKLSWEIKIEDQASSAIHTSTPSTFAVTNVKLYGVAATDFDVTGIKGIRSSNKALKVTYGSGLVLSYAVAGTSAQVDVIRLDGTRVASFKEAASAKNLSLPVSLTHGNYLVTVRGSNSRLVSSLAVAR